jgi:hypothetical protein
MATAERRITPRFKLHVPLSFHRMEALSGGEHKARAINISTRGVCFATSLAVSVGEAIEILLEIPKRVTGEKGMIRRFTGRVAHIESMNVPQGALEIGVQLLYYERDLAAIGS